MKGTPHPFSKYEFMIAWRYLRSKRTEGGVSTMTWISLIGITLAVFALIATLAVRSGFRTEIVDTVLGANAHVTIYRLPQTTGQNQVNRSIQNYEQLADILRSVEGVKRAAPLIKGQVMANANSTNAGVEVFGISQGNLMDLRRIVDPETVIGRVDDFANGVAIGSGVARALGVGVGDQIKLISPDGVKTAFGTSPRVKSFPVSFIFSAGRHDMDKVRVYMPFTAAQDYFNRADRADEIEVLVTQPDQVEDVVARMAPSVPPYIQFWSWKDASGNYLRAVSGLIMLVKNKGRDIGILRTMGLSEGAVLRVFLLCGAFTGVLGTFFGTILGCLFAIYVDTIFAFVNYVSGGGVWDPSIRGIYEIPAELKLDDVITAVTLSLGLSFGITYFPARRAARMNPVEALRYE
ncbi:MAG: FtsX-like permease family protein [Rhodobacteraceae bacterium]|nr:FtsX-like permease family protein [Paracoccaceae bacterium]